MTVVPPYLERIPLVAPLARREIRAYQRRHGELIDFTKGWWQPPVRPEDVLASEVAQIRRVLRLNPIVSITDHDTIEACLVLQGAERRPCMPLSFEWTVPFNADSSISAYTTCRRRRRSTSSMRCRPIPGIRIRHFSRIARTSGRPSGDAGRPESSSLGPCGNRGRRSRFAAAQVPRRPCRDDSRPGTERIPIVAGEQGRGRARNRILTADDLGGRSSRLRTEQPAQRDDGVIIRRLREARSARSASASSS